MGMYPSLKLDGAASSATPQPQEYAGYPEVRFENYGPNGYVHIFLSKSDPPVAYHDGSKWIITNGAAIGEDVADGQEWDVILGQAKLAQ